MAVVFYKFKSAKQFDLLPIDSAFISVQDFKRRVFRLKLNRGTDTDLIVVNAQTNEEYTEKDALIPRNTSVLLRRVPRHPCMPIVAEPECCSRKAVDDCTLNITPEKSIQLKDQILFSQPEGSEWDDFGADPFAIVPEGQPAQSFNPANVTSSNKIDEDRKLQAVHETSSLDWMGQKEGPRGRGYGPGNRGRMSGDCGFGMSTGLFEHRNLPPGYVCRRCNVPGHFIQECPTKGNRVYNRKQFNPPESMLMTTSEGSYALPSGAVAVLPPDSAAFEKEMQAIPTIARAASSTDLLLENLRCPICKEIMEAAVLTKCCFSSFCDKCIRGHIKNESRCVCGSRHASADILVPNKTLRETVIHMVESAASSSWEKVGSVAQSCVTTEDKASSRVVPGSRLIEVKGPTLVEDNAEKPPTGDAEEMIKKKRQRRSEEVGSVTGFMPMAGPGYKPSFSGAAPHTAMDRFSAFLPSRLKKRPRARMDSTYSYSSVLL